ncbi:MAG: carbon monoxide dehydrogenase, partial [Silicimonas sp.]|nr:carbon monoxide dehydrogenase [Silicimonas sp.]
MDLSDEILIPAPREKVYAALNDTDVLRDCIPGCEELERTGENELAAKVVLKVGPVKAKFSGEVTLDPAGAPERFSLSGK